jgi:glycosyltransferase involved in cell wall biosynthesis
VSRVGFVLEGWIGGQNYQRNLFTALRETPEAGIAPVLLLGHRTALPEGWEGLGIEPLRTPLVQAGDPRWAARRAVIRLLDREPWLLRLLAAHGVEALSHSGHLGPRSPIPALSWIPDFQHRHLPDLFPRGERARRDAWHGVCCRLSARVIVSSEAARADLARFHPVGAEKARVLRFVDSSSPAAADVGRAALEARYGFSGPYLLLPNQFWVHKNHAVVVEALALLRTAGREVQVLCTGDTTDYRRPDHFPALMRRVAEAGIGRSFRVLGRIPYADLGALMRHAVAIVNPSRFEGWSTSVEEAKSLGKQVVLSDLAVHREQAPERAFFFDPFDPDAAAAALRGAWEAHSPDADADAAARAACGLPERRRAFALAYASIVREVLTR